MMCLLESNISRDRFIKILKQIKSLVEEKSDIIPDSFWENKINKAKEEM